jgi:hypothetical protein
MNQPSSEEFDKIKEMVLQHKVCWEVGPEYHINKKSERIQIGFELDLIGTHYHPIKTPLPGCDECVKVYEDLKRIAQWIMPKEERDSRYEIRIFDSSIKYAPKRKLRKDITLTIKILHREGFDRPLDACEVECVKEMQKKLKELGVPEGYWREMERS